MDGLAKKLTAWFQSDVALKIVSIVALIFATIGRVTSQFHYDGTFVEGEYVRYLVFSGNILSILFSLVGCVSNILFVLYAFVLRRKMKSGTFCMIYLICGLATSTLTLISYIITYSQIDMPLYIYQHFASSVGSIALTAMILFGLLPQKSSDNSVSSASAVSTLNTDKALKLLNDKLELGIITEEEYRAQRDEIIDKL